MLKIPEDFFILPEVWIARLGSAAHGLLQRLGHWLDRGQRIEDGVQRVVILVLLGLFFICVLLVIFVIHSVRHSAGQRLSCCTEVLNLNIVTVTTKLSLTVHSVTVNLGILHHCLLTILCGSLAFSVYCNHLK